MKEVKMSDIKALLSRIIIENMWHGLSTAVSKPYKLINSSACTEAEMMSCPSSAMEKGRIVRRRANGTQAGSCWFSGPNIIIC